MSAPSDIQRSDHVADLLPAYVNGTLQDSERGRVMSHLGACSACVTELAAWRAIRVATQAASTPTTAAPDVLDRVWAVLDGSDHGSTSLSELRSRPVHHPRTRPLGHPPHQSEETMSTAMLPLIPVSGSVAQPLTLPQPRHPERIAAWIVPALAMIAAVLALMLARSMVPVPQELTRLGSVLPWQEIVPPDVPIYRGNPARTGEMPGPGPTTKPEVLWQVTTGGPTPGAPALVDGVLYAGSADGNFYAFDHATGEERWRFATGSHDAPHATVADGLVFVGDNNPGQDPGHGNLLVLDAATGTERWRLPNAQTSTPLVVDGTLYLGIQDGFLLALNAADGTERWRAETGQVSRGVTLADGVLYVAGKDDIVYALDAATGEERWRYQTEGGTLGTAAVADGIVYEVAFDGPADQLYALDAATGAERWRFAVGSRLQPPAVRDGVVYLPAGDGSLYALDASKGTARWRFAFDDPTVYVPVLAGETVYVTGASPTLFAVDATTGEEQWRVDLDDPIGAAPIVSGGVIYLGTQTGSLYALGLPSAERPVVLPAPDGEAAGGPAEFLWQAADGSASIGRIGGSAIAPNGSLWVVDGDSARILIFSPDGAFLEAWGTPGPSEGEFNFVLENYGGGYGDVAFDGEDNLYVLDSGNYRVQKFDRARHFVTAWGEDGTGNGQFLGPMTMLVTDDGTVYVGDDVRGDIQKFASDGTYLATVGSQGDGDGQFSCIPSFGIDSQGNLVVPDCGKQIIQTFGPNGVFLNSWGSEGRNEGQFQFPVDVAFDAEGNIYVADAGNNRVQVFDREGRFLTSWGRFGTGPGEFQGTSTLALDGAGNIYVGDDGNGRIQKFRLLPPFGTELVATPTT